MSGSNRAVSVLKWVFSSFHLSDKNLHATGRPALWWCMMCQETSTEGIPKKITGKSSNFAACYGTLTQNTSVLGYFRNGQPSVKWKTIRPWWFVIPFKTFRVSSEECCPCSSRWIWSPHADIIILTQIHCDISRVEQMSSPNERASRNLGCVNPDSWGMVLQHCAYFSVPAPKLSRIKQHPTVYKTWTEIDILSWVCSLLLPKRRTSGLQTKKTLSFQLFLPAYRPTPTERKLCYQLLMFCVRRLEYKGKSHLTFPCRSVFVGTNLVIPSMCDFH